MQLLVLTWPYALIFWIAFAWTFLPESRIVARRNEGWATSQDAYSKAALMLAQVIGMCIAFTIALTVRFGALPHPMLFFWVGVVALIVGSLLRRHCRSMLGSSFTGTVIVNPNHAIIERGAYRYVRHPSYTAALVIFFGIGSALANWISFTTLLVIVVIAFFYRVNVEERALVAVVGDPYRHYMQRTKRFVPFLY
jgi:protein-S-isoprenylcysteine O-methyltransferase Ste14